MSEIIHPPLEGRFHNLLAQELEGREFEGKNIAVLAIGGLPGSGVSSTCFELGTKISDKTGRQAKISVFEKERDRIYFEKTGKHRVEYYSPDELQASIDTDLHMVRQMVNPENKGSVLIMDGRLAPFIAREMEFAEKDLLEQGRIKNPAPFEVLTAYLFAPEDIRHSRKYLEAALQDPTLSFEQYREILKKTTVDENAAFARTWPDLRGMTPNNMAAKIRGKRLYDLTYDTGTHSNAEITANKILEDVKTQVLLLETALNK